MKGYGVISALDVFMFRLNLGKGRGGALKQTSCKASSSLLPLDFWKPFFRENAKTHFFSLNRRVVIYMPSKRQKQGDFWKI
jgi:hypothetical protein